MSGYFSTWYEMVCPKCNKHQFVDAGDTTDLTGFDPEGCKCYSCGTCFDFEGEVQEEEEAMFDEGEHLVKIEPQEVIKNYKRELYNADPNCEHEVVDAPGGGVKCRKCNGWFCY